MRGQFHFLIAELGFHAVLTENSRFSLPAAPVSGSLASINNWYRPGPGHAIRPANSLTLPEYERIEQFSAPASAGSRHARTLKRLGSHLPPAQAGIPQLKVTCTDTSRAFPLTVVTTPPGWGEIGCTASCTVTIFYLCMLLPCLHCQ